jgi:hypothetical protein
VNGQSPEKRHLLNSPTLTLMTSGQQPSVRA